MLQAGIQVHCGEKYILGSKYARSYTVSESANISVRKLPDVAAIKMVPDNTTILEEHQTP